MNVRRWINRVSKVVFFGALVVAARILPPCTVLNHIDEVWQTAYRTEVPRKESVAEDFGILSWLHLQGQKPGLHRLYPHSGHALKLSGYADRKRQWNVLFEI